MRNDPARVHSHGLSDGDRDFRAAFEARSIAPARFDHEAHVRLAYVYLTENDVDPAVQRMRARPSLNPTWNRFRRRARRTDGRHVHA